MPENSYATV
nr:unnamed protein product [Callosobruchus analis]